MTLWAWYHRFRRPSAPVPRPRPGYAMAFRPQVNGLDDRLTPSATPFAAGFGSTGPVTHFLVVTPESTEAGAASPVTVAALDASNRLVRDYTGTVHLISTDPSATLPGDYTFTARDRGVHTFRETPAATGTETITATDATNATVSGSASLTVTPAPVATHLVVMVRPQATAGQPVQVVVAAADASNRLVRDYTGTVHLTSTDPTATLPEDYTFTAADKGVHIFTVTPGASGSQTITATDAGTGSVAGTTTLSVTPAQVATHFQVVVRARAAAGEATQIVVLALDASNRVVPNYTGTVRLTSTDSGATLPAEYTFTAADRGARLLTVTPAATGTQTITATNTTTSSVSGTATLSVVSAGSGPAGGRHGFGPR